MQHFRIILGLLLATIAFTFFSSYTAHADTLHVASPPYWKVVTTWVKSSSISSVNDHQAKPSSLLRPNATDSTCVDAVESDTSWGTTSNSIGRQLNLNNVFFGAENNCSVDAVSGSYRVFSEAICPNKTTGGGVVTSGALGYLSAGLFTDFLNGTIIVRCLHYVNGVPVSSWVPNSETLIFQINANLSGGTSSESYAYQYYRQ